MKKVRILLMILITLLFSSVGCDEFLNRDDKHIWDEGLVEKEASCLDQGVVAFRCFHCGATKTESIPALGHDFSNEAVEDIHLATPAVEDGPATYYKSCSRCGTNGTETFAYKEPSPHEHVWDEGSGMRTSSCTEAGGRIFKCTVDGCKASKTIKSDALDHSEPKRWESDSSFHWKECPICKSVFNKERHDFSNKRRMCKCGIDARFYSVPNEGHEQTIKDCGDVRMVSVLLGKIENATVFSGPIHPYSGLGSEEHTWRISEEKSETISEGVSLSLRECISKSKTNATEDSVYGGFTGSFKVSWRKRFEAGIGGNISGEHRKKVECSVSQELETLYTSESSKAFAYTKKMEREIKKTLCPEECAPGFYRLLVSADCNVYGHAFFDKETNVLIGTSYSLEYIPDTFGERISYDPDGKAFGKNNDSPELFFETNMMKGILSFDSNGGSSDFEPKEFRYGEPAGKLPTPKRKGFLFEGWYTASEGGTFVSANTLVHEVGDVALYAHWRKDNLYRMERKPTAHDSYYDSSTEESRQTVRAHHEGWELGRLEVEGFSNSMSVAGIYDEEGFVINYKLEQDIHSIPNPRNVVIETHCITDDTWNKGFRDYDCKSTVGRIGRGTYVVRVEYDDGDEEFVETDFLDGMGKGESKQIFSSSQLDKSRQLRNIHVMVVYETLHSFHYGICWIPKGWKLIKDYANWMCWYDFTFM